MELTKICLSCGKEFSKPPIRTLKRWASTRYCSLECWNKEQHKSPRQEAIARGESFYVTGKPCKHGHIGRRNVWGKCYECEHLHNTLYKQHQQERNPLVFILYGAKRHAREIGKEFSITPKDIERVDCCPLIGIKLQYRGKGFRTNNSASIDRIDSTKGYIKGNVWIVSDRANRIKRDASFEEFEKIYLGWKNKLSV